MSKIPASGTEYNPNTCLILSINAGSSSLKVSLYRRSQESTKDDQALPSIEPIDLVLKYSITDITSPPAKYKFAYPSNPSAKEVKNEPVEEVHDHAQAFEHFLKVLGANGIKEDQILHACHRVVHGGNYDKPTVISKQSYHHIEALTDLAPLHNGSALSVINACMEQLPKADSIAFFDSSFHSTMPEHVKSYAINQEIAKERGLKRYGFHGLSYSYILRSIAQYLRKPVNETNLIALHLGSGASVVAIHKGRSIDTSMGLTPVSGLPGATRSGLVDPSLVFHYTNKAGKMTHQKEYAVNIDVTEAEQILNTQSGWKSLTGTTNFAEISPSSPDPCKRLAFNLFLDRILAFVGSYHLKLEGQVDALVFAGGIGEKSVELREAVGRAVRCLGYEELDEGVNEGLEEREEEGVVGIGKRGCGRVEGKRLLVCWTDEQLEMARECGLDERF